MDAAVVGVVVLLCDANWRVAMVGCSPVGTMLGTPKIAAVQ